MNPQILLTLPVGAEQGRKWHMWVIGGWFSVPGEFVCRPEIEVNYPFAGWARY